MKPLDPLDVEYTWHNSGDVAQQALADLANRGKDRADTELDAKRVSGGLTLDEYFAIRGEN